MRAINIVVPMAGAGSRFKIAEYDTPKPFIKFNGKMMIEHALSSFSKLEAEFTLVLQEKFVCEQTRELEYLKHNYSLNFVTVPKLTMGAAITALAAHNKINPNLDILFADSDNIFNPEDIYKFLENVRSRHLAGALLTFNSDNPCFSYANIDADGVLIETREKEVISNHAIAGVYYFKTLELFMNSVIDLIVETDLSKGEFYMSNVYNHLKKFSKSIGVYDIEHFDCVGTPEQLIQYIERTNGARV